MSFNFSVREAKAFHRSLAAQVTVVEGAGISLSTGAGISQGYDYRRFDPNNPPPIPEVPLPYGYRRADSYRSPSLDDLVRTANGGVPSPVAPWAEWEGSIADEAVDEAAVDRVVSVLQGPISAWAERVTRRQTAADNGYATPDGLIGNRAEEFRRRADEYARGRGRLPTATRFEAEAMAAQTGMIALDLETDPRMAPHRVYRPPTAPPQAFLDPQAVEQMRHETMRTMEELRAAQRAYIRSPEEVTLSTFPNIATGIANNPDWQIIDEAHLPVTGSFNGGVERHEDMYQALLQGMDGALAGTRLVSTPPHDGGNTIYDTWNNTGAITSEARFTVQVPVVAHHVEVEISIPANSRPDDVMVASTDVLTVTPEAMSEAGAAAAELVREAMNRSGVVSMVMEGRGLPHTRTINAGVIIDPSDIP